MQMSNWLTIGVAITGALGTGVTAVATFFLWRVTRTLAIETKRMAEASARPQIVATLEPNQWSIIHADLVIANTGNATAFDIHVSFDPPLQNGEPREVKAELPLQNISILKPGHSISSYLSEFTPLMENPYEVTITWLRKPSDKTKENNTYTLDMRHAKGITRLGSANPLIQIAEQVKKMREDWQQVARGSQRIDVDVFTSFDRLHSRRTMDRMRRQRRRETDAALSQQGAAQSPPAETPPSDNE